ncbi:MAG: zf-HC2 domain-containing protein [Anaerolineales bacterium]
MHVSYTDLRAYADQELDATRAALAREHLAGCPDCRVRLQAVTQQAQRVSARLAALAPQPVEAPRPASIVMARVKQQSRKDMPTMFKSLFSKRPLWAGLAVVLVLALSFSFAPVRAWAGQFLGLFRVEQIQVLPIDTTQLGLLTNDTTLVKQISQLFADSVKVTHEPGQPVVAASAAEASQLAGFPVRLLGAASGDPVITVQDGPSFEVVISRQRTQAFLNEAGRSDLVLPASVDGAKISVVIPTEATAAYGNCPKDGPDEASGRADFELLRTCVLLAQVPSPTVNTPPDLDVPALAELGLQFTGMTAEEAHAYSQNVDWTTTLVIPMPRNASSSTQVAVDGVTGTLLARAADDGVPQRYMLVWVKNGIINALSGFGTTTDALALANSIH